MAVFYSERAIKATRKTHHCFVCPQMIEAGSPAIYFSMRDDYFLDGHYHVDCREAEIALNNLRGTWGKDWQSLYDLDVEDRDWLQAEYPAVYARKYGEE